jgi:sugar lactone lactonase YvrE
MMVSEGPAIECAAATGDICGEGAVWHPEEGVLYGTDINRFLVHRLDPKTRAVHTWLFEEPVTSVNLTSDPTQLLLIFASRVGIWSPALHPRIQTLFSLPAAPEMRFNDARVDPRGSLWVGTMRNNVGPDGEDIGCSFTNGVLYRLDPSGEISEWKHAIGISNTVAWSPDRRFFYIGDTTANVIYRYGYDERTGTISGELRFLQQYEHGLPDGSAIDADGFLWNTRPGAGCIIRIAPDGQIDKKVQLPIVNPTTCAFGGARLTTLYITSARSSHRLSGSVFAMNVSPGGFPDNRFSL